MDEVVGGVDALMMLRIQFERSSSIGSAREYRQLYGLTRERERSMRPGAWVMHPGPMNRGLEIDGQVADGERSLVLGQVANGPRVRAAALLSCIEACRESCTGAG